ncbi:F-box protein [Phanerochaete sordida]|uniref:F-box protein n=1 Tax=Phanerochaete sordida TaxID=48140 RepID=A0A9P3LEQ9_9APHY|nr:F-box protein [Phanerochaete sordida]
MRDRLYPYLHVCNAGPAPSIATWLRPSYPAVPSSSRVMHPVLQIDEILVDILSTVDRASLRSLGLACKTFYEPAMNALWYRIHSLVPLLACLPEDAVERDEHGSVDWNSCIPRALTSTDWARFEAHAWRVREYIVVIGYRYYPSLFDLSHAMSLAIIAHFGDRPMLPNLLKFENEHIGLCTKDAQLLLKPPVAVRVARLDSKSGDDTTGALIANLLIIRDLDGIEELSVGAHEAMSSELFLLAGMPRLTYLSIVINDSWVTPDWMSQFSTLPAGSFSALRTLKYSSTALDTGIGAGRGDIEQFLTTLDTFLAKATSCMPFSCLMVKFHRAKWHSQYEDKLHMLCSCIAMHCPTLESLVITTDKGKPSARAVLPLCNIRGLHTLKLARILPSDLTPDAIRTMGAAWPHLRELHLGTKHPDPGITATVTMLHALLDALPALAVLGLPVRAHNALGHSAPEQLAAATRPIVPHAALRLLDLGRVYVPDFGIEQFAAALVRLAPAAEVRSSWLHARSSQAEYHVKQERNARVLAQRVSELARERQL